MKLKTFEEYEFGNDRDYTDEINLILDALIEKGIEIEDPKSHYNRYQTKKSASFIIDDCPVQLSFVTGHVVILIEIDGITDNFGEYNVDTQLDTVIDILSTFSKQKYLDNQ